MYVLDGELNPLPTGVAGELYIGGVGVARGYLGRPGLTADRFLPDPFAPEPGSRFYRTGDLARLRSDGELEFLGRIDNQVKIRGYRIELGEIEARLLTHPGLREAVVTARPDRAGQKRLVAYVVPVGPAPTAADLRGFLTKTLPDYMLPAVFVVLDALPLSSGGKVDRAALPEPGTPRAERNGTFLAPRTPTEEVLAGIWADVLDVERVGVRDEFLELGGHSLLALRLAGRVRATAGPHLSVTSLLRATTVEAQAHLMDGRAAADTPLVPLRPGGVGVPLVLVHPVGGTVLCYADLVRALDRPVFGLTARGLDGAQPPVDRIEHLAEDYLAAIGPLGEDVALGGWSMGGLVAFEMARLLHRRTGRAVPLLLFDSYAPTTAERPAMSEEEFRTWFAHDRRSLSDLAPDLMDPVMDVARANVGAAARYVPRSTYPGPVTVLSAADESDPDPTRGWRTWTTGEIHTVRVPGDHYTFLRAPNVASAADKL